MKKPIMGALNKAVGRAPVLHIPSVSFAMGDQGFHVSGSEYELMEKSFKRLSARSLLMASSGDALILDKQPDGEYLALLRACGAGGARLVVPSGDGGQSLSEDARLCPATLEFIRAWEGPVEFYMLSQADIQLAAQAGWDIPLSQAQITYMLNDKVFFVRTMEDLGLPRIEAFTGAADSTAARLDKDPGGPVVVRSSHSVGGAAVWVADGAAERLALKKRVEKRRGEAFVLQKWIPSVMSPNAQLYVGDTEICLLGITLQIMEGRARHAGNYFGGTADAALDETILAQSAALAREAAALGYRGILGVDFIVTGAGEVYAVEMNARHNTSTHALWFANTIANGDPLAPLAPGRGAYRKWPSARGPLSAMEWIKLLGAAGFDPAKGEGILPYDCGSGSLEAVVIGSGPDHLKRLEEMAERIAWA